MQNCFAHNANYCLSIPTYQDYQDKFPFAIETHFTPIVPSSSLSSSSTAKTLYFSSAHAPKSICLQRSEQNGRYRLDSFHSTSLPHTGHLTIVTMSQHKVNSQGISSSNGLGFIVPSCFVNRIQSIYLFSEASGMAPLLESIRKRNIWCTFPCSIC